MVPKREELLKRRIWRQRIAFGVQLIGAIANSSGEFYMRGETIDT